jgi:HAMP domain-containing protein
MIVRRTADGTRHDRGRQPRRAAADLDRRRAALGRDRRNVYGVVPLPTAVGHRVRASPTRGSLGRISATLGFLQSLWWQFLLAGTIAAVIALGISRWLARGMTQPLRDMAAAARRMETGDYTVRVHTTSRDEVGQLATAFNRMSQELENLETSRRDLVANVSHELKTPITAIRAHLENLLDGVEQPNPETLQVMLAQSERLGRLVEQLLDLSKLESGEVPLRREGVPLGPVVREVISEIEVARADATCARRATSRRSAGRGRPRARCTRCCSTCRQRGAVHPAGGEVTDRGTGARRTRGGRACTTPASASRRGTCPVCSSGSTGSTARASPWRRRARASASRSPARSSRRTAARSRPTSEPGHGARSPSISRGARPRPDTTGGRT